MIFRIKKKSIYIIGLLLMAVFAILVFSEFQILQFSNSYKVGQKIDSLNGVYVYYNGKMGNVSGRNTIDGYNIGLKYQCVEFVKRYYLVHYKHKMPNSYGHAKDFIQNNLKDGELNKPRSLIQYKNLSHTKPKAGDIIVFDGHIFNKFGHIAIISNVTDAEVEIIQQNTGTTTREMYQLSFKNDLWKINKNSILGRLRKQ
jgi:hypothetical protein